jgi:hypothetical protein
MKDAIVNSANGLFLYAKLAMDTFTRESETLGVQEGLGMLPNDLTTTYTGLLREHARRSHVVPELQLFIFQCVVYATRPLRLLELAELVSLMPSRDQLDLKARKRFVRVACGPLLDILPDETVRIVHHSFTEFLKNTSRHTINRIEYPVLESGPTNIKLAIACLEYLQSGSLAEWKLKKWPRF